MVVESLSARGWAVVALVLGCAGCGQVAVGVLLATSGGGGSSGLPTPTETFTVTLNEVSGTGLGGTAVIAEAQGWTFSPTDPLRVRVAGVEATTVSVLNETQLQFVTPPNPRENRTTTVGVEIQSGVGLATNAQFRYDAFPPRIDRVEPEEVFTSGGQQVRLVGVGFVGSTSVSVGGFGLVSQVVSNTELVFTTPSHPAGAVDLVVRHPESPQTTVFGGLTYVDPPPAFLRFLVQPSAVVVSELAPAPWRGYAFEEGSGTVAGDVGASGADLVGTFRWVAGRSGGALQFDGVSQHAVGPSLPSLGLEADFTWAADVLVYAGVDSRAVIFGSRGLGLTPAGFEFPGVPEGSLDHAVPPGRWVHVALVKDGPRLTSYLDGVEVAAATTSQAAPSAPFFVGGTPDGSWWLGAIDALRLFTGALSAREVATLAGLSVPQAITPAVEVEVLDASGARYVGYEGPVTLGLDAVAGLGGTVSVDAVAGRARFEEVFVGEVGSFRLRASAGPAERESLAFVAGVGPPARLGFTARPRVDVAGGASLASVRVEVYDVAGNRVTPSAPVALTLEDHTVAATLQGGGARSVAGGVVDFGGLALDRVGFGYRLEASLAGVPPARSERFDVASGPPTGLRILTGPRTQRAGGSQPGPLRVEVVDAQGRRVAGSEASIALQLESNPSGASLVGGAARRAVRGVATFPGVAVSESGVGYTLRAEAQGVAPAVTDAFDVEATPFQLQGAPTDLTAGLTGGAALGDLDNDGWLDRVVSYQQLGTIGVALGRGDGTFGPETQRAVGGSPTALLLGRFDADAALDVVVVDEAGEDLLIYLGDGAGGFPVEVRQPVGEVARHLVGGDFDRDGAWDVVVWDVEGERLRVLRGNGAGGVAGEVVVSLGLEAGWFEAGDWDGDGWLDLVATGRNHEDLLVVFGDGGGGFEAPEALTLEDELGWIVAGDLDRDGDLDLVVGSPGSGTTVLHNDGSGRFEVVEEYTVGRFQALIDVDLDGVLDLVWHDGREALWVRPNRGDGTFYAPVREFTSNGALCVGDLNRDGASDLVIFNGFGGAAYTLLGGRPRWGLAAWVTIPRARSVVAGDMDGRPGVELVTLRESTVEYWSRESLAAGVPEAELGLGDIHGSLSGGDFDGDGLMDVLIPTLTRDELQVALTRLPLRGVRQPVAPTRDLPRGVCLVDLDQDGALDVLVSGESGDPVPWHRGQGDGSFASAVALPVGGGQRQILSGALNGDPWPDLVVSRAGTSLVSVWRTSGPGVFTVGVDHDMGAPPIWLEFADVDGDGALDLLSGSSDAARLGVRLGDGAGGFGPLREESLPSPVRRFAVGDVNGDGDLDVLAACWGHSALLGLEGRGDGSFEAARVVSAWGTSDVLLVDLDGDGPLEGIVGGGSGVLQGLHVISTR